MDKALVRSLQILFGVYPYTYLWSSGETTREINNKPAGIYIVTMTDSLNNTDVDTFELRQPDALSYSPDITDYNGFNVRSNGGDDGQVILFPSGGTPPYKCVWSDGYQQYKRNNMSAGTYSFTISDANQCSTTGSVTLIAPSPLQFSFSNIQNPTCYGSEDGSVQLNISGGIGDYTVSWDNGSFELNPTDLINGYNEVRIYDNGRLVIDTGIVLTEPPPVTANIVLSDYNGFNVSCVDCFNGTINANVTGGTAPYVFDWKDDPNITGPNRSNLNGGFYPVTISDVNGCQPKRETIITLTMPNQKDWSRQGNANIDPNDFIGSTDASDVLFKTNNQEALRLMGNGNIGVGTSSPTEKLEVNGTIKAQGLKLNNLNFRYESASGLIPEKITWGSEDNAPWGTAGTPVLPYNCLDQVLVNRFNLFKGAAVFKAPASTPGCNNN